MSFTLACARCGKPTTDNCDCFGGRVINIGDEVEWTSQSQGHTRTKRGVVVGVIAAGFRPEREDFPTLYSGAGPGYARNHDSFVVRVKGRGLYWPIVKKLRKTQP